MTGESFEWAIKKDVRNNPIVREVDRERHREMFRSVSISVFLVLVVLFSEWQQLELRVGPGARIVAWLLPWRRSDCSGT